MKFFKTKTGRLCSAALLAAAVLAPIAISQPAGAIIGGTATSPSVFPSFVRVYSPSGLCGGTVIAPDTILTAGHCVVGAAPSGVTVYVNDTQPYQATAVMVHPLYAKTRLADIATHDLALVSLAPGATQGVPNVQVGAPWQPEYRAAGREAWMVGHGRTSADSAPTSELRYVQSVIRSDDFMDDIFNRRWTPDYWTSELNIGAGGSQKTTCFGDSGGPLFIATGVWVQVGVSSFVWPFPGCSEAAGFAELSGPQLAWIAEHVPSIRDQWGSCTTPLGNAGYSLSHYSPTSVGSGRDGAYFWAIDCVGDPLPPPPPPPVCHGRNCQEQ
jgi:Trypsin